MKRENYYWLNEDSRTFLGRGYLLEGETPEQRFRDIAETAEKILGISGFADKFENYIKRGYYSLSSPVISNFGRDRGLPISCFGSCISDKMESILEKLSEVGMMTKGGGGTSGYFGAIRGRGTPISSGGTSTGSVHFMELFDKLMNVVSQGNVRRGSFAAYLPVEHPDINEFLKIRDEGSNIQDLSIGVTISDEWMKSMLGGNSEKRKIWAAIIKKRFESGYPYLMFADNANNQAPQVYKDKGLRINNSNLCVTGDTKIEIKTSLNSKSFLIDIQDLKNYDLSTGVYVNSYNEEDGEYEFCKILAYAKTGEEKNLIKISNRYIGSESILCTEEHKIYTSNRGYIKAKDLSEDDTLLFERVKLSASGGNPLIEKVKLPSPVSVFDITVEKNHNFSANGILISNCNEIYLSNSPDESFVCCLGSMNLDQYDEWKDTDAVKTYIYFLDAVISEFINKTEGVRFMEAPRKFSINQRALGLGVLGWHSLLQQRMIPFESMQAKYLNVEIFKLIREQADQATQELAQLLGEPPLLQGYGRRNSTTLSVAPTTSSSFLLGQVSPSIEPLESCYFVKDLAKGRFTYKNPYLMELLEKKGKNSDGTWLSILKEGGSVQHLDFLTDDEKDVFKTFRETNQREIVIQNIQRQKYVDQGISLNLMIPHNTKAKDVSELLIYGWENGLKGFYYQRSTNPSKELARSIMKCKSCEA